MCDCINIKPGSSESYQRSIVVDIPSHMANYKSNRLKNGLSGKICIDPCIYDEISKLWKIGITTYGCCCGHNDNTPYVNVDDKNIQQMLDMGYEQCHDDASRRDTFRLKTN